MRPIGDVSLGRVTTTPVQGPSPVNEELPRVCPRTWTDPIALINFN